MAFFFAPSAPFDGMHFDVPVFVAPHRRARGYSSSPCSSSSSSPCCGGGGGGGLLKLAMLMLFLPSMMRVGFFFFATLVQTFFSFAVIASVAMLLRAMSSKDGRCPMMMCRRGAACAAKKDDSTACAAKKDDCTATAAAAAAASKPSAKESGHERLDLSSVQFVAREDEDKETGALMTLVVAAPGVRAADLTVSAVDRYLHIKGESVKGRETFCVDRRILVPHGADLDTISATHAEGTLTLVIRRKVPKRIEVGVAPRMDAAAARGAHMFHPAAAVPGPSASTSAPTQEEIDQYERELERADPVQLPLDEWEEAVPLARAFEKKHE